MRMGQKTGPAIRRGNEGERTLRLIATVAAFALSSLPAQAFDVTAMTDAERAALQAEIKDYLINNPDILIEVAQALEVKQNAAQAGTDRELIAANAEAIFNDPASFVGGNPEGSITLVEFIDYRCGYCRKAHPEIAELVKSDGDIRYVVKEFPILGEESVIASKFAIATLRVAGPEAYLAVNAGLYEGFRGEFTPETLGAFAEGLGIDPGPILADMDSPEVAAIIEANHNLAKRLQISGTPTFVLGDSMLRGYLPLADMRAIVAEERG
jgi:protein-disulfide isomerase